MRVVLLRHATRDSLGLGDVPLNKTGKRQAEDLARKVGSSGELPAPDRLLASPKRRAQETLTPLAQASGKKVETEPRLDERKNSESIHDFENRIRSLVQELNLLADNTKSPSEVVYLCSHFDWLEAAMVLIDSDLSDLEMSSGWSPCDYKIFRIDGMPKGEPSEEPNGSLREKLWIFEGKGSIAPEGI